MYTTQADTEAYGGVESDGHGTSGVLSGASALGDRWRLPEIPRANPIAHCFRNDAVPIGS